MSTPCLHESRLLLGEAKLSTKDAYPALDILESFFDPKCNVMELQLPPSWIIQCHTWPEHGVVAYCLHEATRSFMYGHLTEIHKDFEEAFDELIISQAVRMAIVIDFAEDGTMEDTFCYELPEH